MVSTILPRPRGNCSQNVAPLDVQRSRRILCSLATQPKWSNSDRQSTTWIGSHQLLIQKCRQRRFDSNSTCVFGSLLQCFPYRRQQDLLRHSQVDADVNARLARVLFALRHQLQPQEPHDSCSKARISPAGWESAKTYECDTTQTPAQHEVARGTREGNL